MNYTDTSIPLSYELTYDKMSVSPYTSRLIDHPYEISNIYWLM